MVILFLREHAPPPFHGKGMAQGKCPQERLCTFAAPLPVKKAFPGGKEKKPHLRSYFGAEGVFKRLQLRLKAGIHHAELAFQQAGSAHKAGVRHHVHKTG